MWPIYLLHRAQCMHTPPQSLLAVSHSTALLSLSYAHGICIWAESSWTLSASAQEGNRCSPNQRLCLNGGQPAEEEKAEEGNARGDMRATSQYCLFREDRGQSDNTETSDSAHQPPPTASFRGLPIQSPTPLLILHSGYSEFMQVCKS